MPHGDTTCGSRSSGPWRTATIVVDIAAVAFGHRTADGHGLGADGDPPDMAFQVHAEMNATNRVRKAHPTTCQSGR